MRYDFFSLLILNSNSTEVIIIVLSTYIVQGRCKGSLHVVSYTDQNSVSLPPVLFWVHRGRLERLFGEVEIDVMWCDHPLVLELWNGNNI